MLDQDWETVVNALEEAFAANRNKSDEELPDEYTIPDYSSLLLENGDKALFSDDDYEKAIREYKAALFQWRTKYGHPSKDYSLTVDAKDKLRAYVELLIDIHDGNAISNDISFLDSDVRRFVNHYMTILEKHDRHDEVVEETEELIAIIEDYLQKDVKLGRKTEYSYYPTMQYGNQHPLMSSSELNAYRIIKVIIPKLYQFACLDEISYLANQKGQSNQDFEKLKLLALKKALNLDNTEYRNLYLALQQADEKRKWHILAETSKVQNDIQNIKRQLLINGKIPLLGYYTNWKTLSYLLPEESADKANPFIGRLSVMHISYMNDPMEGTVIDEYIYENKQLSGRRETDQPYAFVKCFTEKIDDLPMWKMYGDNAEGCCLVIDWDETKKLNRGRGINLYRICYLSKKKGKYEYVQNENDEAIKGMKALLETLKKDVAALSRIEGASSLSKTMLGSIAYLFKEKTYSYEKEARVLYSFNSFNSQIHMTDQEPPRLFVYTDYQVAIKELILGPKFRDIYLWSPYIKSRIESLNKSVNQETPTKITISDINYR